MSSSSSFSSSSPSPCRCIARVIRFFNNPYDHNDWSQCNRRAYSSDSLCFYHKQHTETVFKGKYYSKRYNKEGEVPDRLVKFRILVNYHRKKLILISESHDIYDKIETSFNPSIFTEDNELLLSNKLHCIVGYHNYHILLPVLEWARDKVISETNKMFNNIHGISSLIAEYVFSKAIRTCMIKLWTHAITYTDMMHLKKLDDISRSKAEFIVTMFPKYVYKQDEFYVKNVKMSRVMLNKFNEFLVDEKAKWKDEEKKSLISIIEHINNLIKRNEKMNPETLPLS